MTRKGLFITVEGVEGAGKTTAVRFLETYFNTLQFKFILTREPGGTEIAEQIRRVLLSHHQENMAADTELLLMFASRAQHIAQVILPALENGCMVISDRFTDATYAYQGGGRGLDATRIAILEQWVQKDLQPDLTLLLDVPIEIGMSRIQSRGAKDRIEHEKLQFFHRVRDIYLQRAAQYPQRFKVIDATQPCTSVQTQLKNIISGFIAEYNVSIQHVARNTKNV